MIKRLCQARFKGKINTDTLPPHDFCPSLLFYYLWGFAPVKILNHGTSSVFTHANGHTDRYTDRQTDTNTHREQTAPPPPPHTHQI